MIGLAMSRGIIALESAVKEVTAATSESVSPASEEVSSLAEVLDAQVAAPMAHTLRMAAGNFNELSVKRRRKLSRAVKDPLLSRWLKETPESVLLLFALDMSGPLEAARARLTDGLITMAARATQNPSSSVQSSSASSRGRRFELYPVSRGRQPFRGARNRPSGGLGCHSARGRRSSLHSSTSSSRDTADTDH